LARANIKHFLQSIVIKFSLQLSNISFHLVASPPFLTFSQAEAVRLELRGNRSRGYMQMDGEPWKQPLGRVDEPATLVEINKLSTPSILLKR
jgi:hypothetical protein